MPQVVVTGAGGIGTTIAGYLARAGVDVVLLGRSTAHIDAVRSGGLTMVGPDGSVERIEVRACTTAAHLGPADHLVIATKTFDTAGAAETSRAVVGPATWISTVQNGLGNDKILAAAFGARRVQPGLTTIGAERTEPGVVRVSLLTTSAMSLTQIGPPRGPGASLDGAEALAALMGAAGLPTEATDKIDEAIWSKLALAVMGPVCALLGATVAEAWAHPDSRALVERMHDEVVATAASEGVPIDRGRSWENAVRTYAGTGDHYPSMATDLRLGRRTEIDAISGAVVSRAERHGMALPVTGAVVRLLRAAESLKCT